MSRPKRHDGPRASFRQLLPFLFEHKGVLIAVTILSVLGAVFTLVQPLLIGQVIERVQLGETLGLLVWGLVAFVILSSIVMAYQHYLLQRTGTAIVYSSRRKLISSLLHLPISEFDRRRTGDLVSRVGTDTTMLYAVLTQGLADSVGNALMFVGALIAMLVIDPVLLASIVGVLVVAAALVGSLSGRIRTATTEQQERVGALASGIERAIGAIRTVRASGATEREKQSVDGMAQDAYSSGIKVARASALVVPIAGVAMQASLLVVLGVGGFRVASGAVPIASLVTFVMFLFLMIMPLGSFFGAMTSVGQALGALGRIQEVLDLPREDRMDRVQADGPSHTDGSGRIANAPEPSDASAEAGTDALASVPAIAFENVRFRYPEAAVATRAEVEREARSLVAEAHLDAGGFDDGADLADGARDAPSAQGRSIGAPGDPVGTTGNAASRVSPARQASADGALAVEGVSANGTTTGSARSEPLAHGRSADTPHAHPDVLQGISFEVPVGKRVALVGPSGAGKSTILALIERFYDVTDGAIRVGGTDVRDLARDALRSHFGYVEQDAPTLAGSIADNLRLASPDASDADCDRVLREVNLGEVIDRSPLGIDTPVGEDGVMLSGGERQRLAIARALLAAPPILLLDESTSSLDGVNEQRMREAIDAVAEGRTLLVIAHRLSTVVDSDRIVVLDKGRVIGQGTHSELVESTPLYRNLAKHQLLV